MKKNVGIGIVIVIFIAGWFFLSTNVKIDIQTQDEDLVTIVTSFYPLQFALEKIVGESGKVVNIGEGRDPHDFRPSTQDILALQRADLVVLQGADFEPWGDDVADQLAASGVPVHFVADHVVLMEGQEHKHKHEDEHEHEEHKDEHKDEHEAHKDEHDHGAFDPHIWLDPVLFGEIVDHLSKAISEINPENKELFEANTAALKLELATLDSEYKTKLANCELDEVITSHDAFGYIAARYGFHVHPIAGISTQDTPSAKVLAELRAEAEEGIGAILIEESSVAAYSETLARETGLLTLSINPIEYLVPADQDYFSIMRTNLDNFATALKCNE